MACYKDVHQGVFGTSCGKKNIPSSLYLHQIILATYCISGRGLSRSGTIKSILLVLSYVQPAPVVVLGDDGRGAVRGTVDQVTELEGPDGSLGRLGPSVLGPVFGWNSCARFHGLRGNALWGTVGDGRRTLSAAVSDLGTGEERGELAALS